MEHRQKVGGIAALVAAGTFLFGIVLFVSLLTDYTTGDPTPAESVAFLVDNQAALYIWNLFIFIVFGIALVPLVLVLRERLRPGSPGFAQAAGAFGLIWAGLVLAAGWSPTSPSVPSPTSTTPTRLPPNPCGQRSTQCRTGWVAETRSLAASGFCSSAGRLSRPRCCHERSTTSDSQPVLPV